MVSLKTTITYIIFLSLPKLPNSLIKRGVSDLKKKKVHTYITVFASNVLGDTSLQY